MNFSNLSLQARLVALMLAAVTLFGVLAGYESYKNALHEVDEIFDAQLAQLGQTLLAVASHADDDETKNTGQAVHKYQQTIAFQVWATEEGSPRLILHSGTAPAALPAPLPPEGYSEGQWQGKQWRFYRQRDTRRNIEVMVGQTGMARNELAREVAWHNVAPFLFGIPLLAFAALMAISFGLRPLRKLAQELNLRSPERLDPIHLEDTPKEIKPVLDALSQLLTRVAATLENERRFTSDAAHELRTPLAALRAQVQAAMLTENSAERLESLHKALQGMDRMSHLVGQLLTLARLDELSASTHLEPVDLAAVTRECCAELGPEALARNIELELAAEDRAPISGSPDLLHVLVRNLLDNAIRYTPVGGHIDVAIQALNNSTHQLEVCDSGPGVPDEQLTQLGQRFSRFSPTQVEGVGLGLSIALRIAEIHQARIAFSRATTAGGLRVSAEFPPPSH
ncbi:sensor histidine kinase [Sulfuricella denitrificans skB26]|uniref:histidine kinase n=1 Tax=Sulfuricella denitrificans (strain DSM 22764 / NBRC 105220 / skB26) TaxID=1163617 RepID=S6AIH4_SULDS|nr:ATP-binding protein [Sulfuricella denitrificans]BAN34319.1 sensor histidine kinase [Sulfuricella denitrificans skB26]